MLYCLLGVMVTRLNFVSVQQCYCKAGYSEEYFLDIAFSLILSISLGNTDSNKCLLTGCVVHMPISFLDYRGKSFQ